MDKAWRGMEKAPPGSLKNRIHGLGLKLLARVRPSEIFLKSITKEVTLVEVAYPPSLNARLVRRRLRHIAMSGTIIHKKYLYVSAAALPLTSALSVLPLPNIPFFWVLFRSYSHWRAKQGSEKLLELVSDESHDKTSPSSDGREHPLHDDSKHEVVRRLGFHRRRRIMAANCPPANVAVERDSKRPKREEEYPGERSSDEIDGNKQVAAEDSDSDDDYDLDLYDGDVELMKQYKLMYKQARRSEGFHVTTGPSKYIPGAIVYALIEESTPMYYEQVQKCLAYAIEDHNRRVKDDEKIELVDIVRAHSTGASIRELFITINARLISADTPKVYQVRVKENMICKEITVIFVRPKPVQ